MGFNLIHKGYKGLSSSDRIYISHDVIVDENAFPYKTKHISSSSSTLANNIPQPVVSNPLAKIPSVSAPVHDLSILSNDIPLLNTRCHFESTSSSTSPYHSFPHSSDLAPSSSTPHNTLIPDTEIVETSLPS